MSEVDRADGAVVTHAEVFLEPINDEQLGLAEKQYIDTQALRKCLISTTVTDLRKCFFFDSALGERREACICFFQVEFGNQRQESRQRISDLSIDVTFNDSDDSDLNQVSHTIDDPELSCKAILPCRAYGTTETDQVSHRMAADIRPAYMDASLGGVTFDKTTRRERKTMMEFRASSVGAMGYRLTLAENAIGKTGVPHILRFGILLQTDGLPFLVELKFVGTLPSVLGTKLKGQVSLNIEKRHLWLRSKADEGTIHCRDADSEGFLEWVKTKTRNPWAETAEYDI